MILKSISAGNLAKCYFPKLHLYDALKMLALYIKDINSKMYLKAGYVEDSLDGNDVWFDKDEIVLIGKTIGIPRPNIADNVCDTILDGLNEKADEQNK